MSTIGVGGAHPASRLRAASVCVASVAVTATLTGAGLRSLRSSVALVLGPQPQPVTVDDQVTAALTTLAIGAAAAAWMAWCLALCRVWRAAHRSAPWPAVQTTPGPWLRTATVVLGVGWLGLASGGQAVADDHPVRPSTACPGTESAGADVDRLDGLLLPSLPSAGRRFDIDGAVHVVAAGDSLWSIAAAQLGPGTAMAAIDHRWRRLYAANRAVIGKDPDLLIPSQRLRLPESPPLESRSNTP